MMKSGLEAAKDRTKEKEKELEELEELVEEKEKELEELKELMAEKELELTEAKENEEELEEKETEEEKEEKESKSQKGMMGMKKEEPEQEPEGEETEEEESEIEEPEEEKPEETEEETEEEPTGTEPEEGEPVEEPIVEEIPLFSGGDCPFADSFSAIGEACVELDTCVFPSSVCCFDEASNCAASCLPTECTCDSSAWLCEEPTETVDCADRSTCFENFKAALGDGVLPTLVCESLGGTCEKGEEPCTLQSSCFDPADSCLEQAAAPVAICFCPGDDGMQVCEDVVEDCFPSESSCLSSIVV